jgi:hypothetical protein
MPLPWSCYHNEREHIVELENTDLPMSTKPYRLLGDEASCPAMVWTPR